MGPNIAGMLCGLIIGLSVMALIGAVILRAAISMYNALAGGPDSEGSVPEPDFGQALGIVFATFLVNVVVGVLLGLALGPDAFGGQRVELKTQLITLPVGMLVMSIMLSAMLPTTFARALLVAICHLIVSVLIVGTIIAVVLAVGLAN